MTIVAAVRTYPAQNIYAKLIFVNSNSREAIKYWEIAALVAILLLAGALRMGWPGLTEFKRDEAQLLTLALDMAEFQEFHARGITSSVGFPNFPMSAWIYSLPLLVWKQVYSATLFTGLVNTAAILGIWWLVRRYWGRTAAIAAIIMFAVSPWAIFHSRKIWAQNLLPPLVVGWAICAVLAFVERRSGFIIGFLLCLALAFQVHFAALALIPATLLMLVVFVRRIEWRYAVAGSILAALSFVPFLVDLSSTAELDLDRLSATTQGFDRGLDLKAWRFTWLLTSGREIHALAGDEAFEEYLASVPDLTPIHVTWGLLVAAGVIWLGINYWKHRGEENKQAEAGIIVLIWLFVPPLFFTIPGLPVELHYLLPTYGAGYIAAGLAFSVLLGRLGRWSWAGWGALAATAALQVWIWLSLLAFIGSRNTPGGFGTPIKYHLHAAETARQLLAESGGGEILIGGLGEDPEEDEIAAVFDLLLREVPRRFVDVGHSAVFPADPAVVLLSGEASTSAAKAYLTSANQIRRLPLRQDEGLVQLMTISGNAAPIPQIRFEPSYLFANWVNFFGHDALLRMPDGELVWKIYWNPGANPDPRDYHFFNHLLDSNGQLVAQADAPAFSPWQWRPGDTVIGVFHLDGSRDAGEPLTMRTGLYTYPSLENMPLLDEAGNPYSDAAEVSVSAPPE